MAKIASVNFQKKRMPDGRIALDPPGDGNCGWNVILGILIALFNNFDIVTALGIPVSADALRVLVRGKPDEEGSTASMKEATESHVKIALAIIRYDCEWDAPLRMLDNIRVEHTPHNLSGHWFLTVSNPEIASLFANNNLFTLFIREPLFTLRQNRRLAEAELLEIEQREFLEMQVEEAKRLSMQFCTTTSHTGEPESESESDHYGDFVEEMQVEEAKKLSMKVCTTSYYTDCDSESSDERDLCVVKEVQDKEANRMWMNFYTNSSFMTGDHSESDSDKDGDIVDDSLSMKTVDIQKTHHLNNFNDCTNIEYKKDSTPLKSRFKRAYILLLESLFVVVMLSCIPADDNITYYHIDTFVDTNLALGPPSFDTADIRNSNIDTVYNDTDHDSYVIELFSYFVRDFNVDILNSHQKNGSENGCQDYKVRCLKQDGYWGSSLGLLIVVIIVQQVIHARKIEAELVKYRRIESAELVKYRRIESELVKYHRCDRRRFPFQFRLIASKITVNWELEKVVSDIRHHVIRTLIKHDKVCEHIGEYTGNIAYYEYFIMYTTINNVKDAEALLSSQISECLSTYPTELVVGRNTQHMYFVSIDSIQKSFLNLKIDTDAFHVNPHYGLE